MTKRSRRQQRRRQCVFLFSNRFNGIKKRKLCFISMTTTTPERPYRTRATHRMFEYIHVWLELTRSIYTFTLKRSSSPRIRPYPVHIRIVTTVGVFDGWPNNVPHNECRRRRRRRRRWLLLLLLFLPLPVLLLLMLFLCVLPMCCALARYGPARVKV